MITIGLTGSIAMGKTTITRLFEEMGAAISNADLWVHQLLSDNKEMIKSVSVLFPESVIEGKIDRKTLGDLVFKDAEALKKLEAILHPEIWKMEALFLKQAEANGKKIAVLDIPLLFETGAEKRFCYSLVVTASLEEQRRRVMQRDGMNEEKFQQILARQMPDAIKRTRADFIVETDKGLEQSAAQVRKIWEKLHA